MGDLDDLLREEALFADAPSPPGEADRAGGARRGAYSHACMGPYRARDPLGSPKVTRGRVPKVPYCCTTESFWNPFWYPFWGPTCTQFYKKLQNGGPKSCQNRPSWAGAWGAWVLAVFIERPIGLIWLSIKWFFQSLVNIVALILSIFLRAVNSSFSDSVSNFIRTNLIHHEIYQFFKNQFHQCKCGTFVHCKQCPK